VNDIARTISQLEQQKAAMDRAISALREIQGLNRAGTSAALTHPSRKTAPPKGQLSPEGRQRIAESNRRRAVAQKAAKAAQRTAAPQRGQAQKKAFPAKKTMVSKTPAKKTATERRSPA
jgi:hypothetical protein